MPASRASCPLIRPGRPGSEVVGRLLAAGADQNASFIHDGAWLQVALYGVAGINGDPELTRMLLAAGADPTDERDGYHGNEVLYHACEWPDPACAMLVIDAGARIDGDPEGQEIPLGHACWRGRVQMTRELVERGAALAFPDGGSAIGTAQHGSRHCHHPEGGPSTGLAPRCSSLSSGLTRPRNGPSRGAGSPCLAGLQRGLHEQLAARRDHPERAVGHSQLAVGRAGGRFDLELASDPADVRVEPERD
jgi:hypothetical protein